MSGAREKLRVATRESRLAMAQTLAVVERIRRQVPGVEVEIVPMRTSGDWVSARWARTAPEPVVADGSGGAARNTAAEGVADLTVGAFVKELEHALLEGRCDVAVHSLKDVPTQLPDGLTLAAFPEREDPRDVLVLPPTRSARAPARELLATLAPGARIGTSSLRRAVQLRLIRPDIETLAVRGNVETRLRRLDEGRYDALVLAAAGLVRLGLDVGAWGWFEPDELVPAPGQGILAVECREDDTRTLAWLAAIDRAELRLEAEAERAFMARTEAGCRWPVGARALVEGSVMDIIGFVALPQDAAACSGPQAAGPEGPGQSPGAPLRRWLVARGRRRVGLSGATPAAWLKEARRAGEALAGELLDRIRAGEGSVVEAAGGV